MLKNKSNQSCTKMEHVAKVENIENVEKLIKSKLHAMGHVAKVFWQFIGIG